MVTGQMQPIFYQYIQIHASHYLVNFTNDRLLVKNVLSL